MADTDETGSDEHGAAEGSHGAATSGGETHAGTEVAGGAHGEPTGTFPPFDSTTFASQLLWLALTFGLLYLIMSKIALPRISEILEVRRDRIEGDLAEADRLRQQTDKAIAAYEDELAKAKANAHAIAQANRDKIGAETAASRADAEADLAGKMAQAEARIGKMKDAALTQVDDIAADTAQSLVAALFGKVTKAQAAAAVAKVLKG